MTTLVATVAKTNDNCTTMQMQANDEYIYCLQSINGFFVESFLFSFMNGTWTLFCRELTLRDISKKSPLDPNEKGNWARYAYSR